MMMKKKVIFLMTGMFFAGVAGIKAPSDAGFRFDGIEGTGTGRTDTRTTRDSFGRGREASRQDGTSSVKPGSRGTQQQSVTTGHTSGSGTGTSDGDAPYYKSPIRDALDRRGKLIEETEKAVADVEAAAKKFAAQMRALNAKKGGGKDAAFDEDRKLSLGSVNF